MRSPVSGSRTTREEAPPRHLPSALQGTEAHIWAAPVEAPISIACMRGVVAAGHPLTAEAGAQILRDGGNAVDAAVGAVLMSFVAESPLTGPGAGGFMLLHTASGEDHLLDFFVGAPGRGLERLEPAAAHADPHPLARRRLPVVQHRPVVMRGLRNAEGSRRGASALRVDAAVGARGRSGARRPGGRGGEPGAGVPVPDPRPDHGRRARGAGDLPGGRTAGARGRRDPAARGGRPAGPSRRRGPRVPLHGRRGRGGERLGAGARRPAHARRPGLVRGGRARAGARPATGGAR